MLDKIKKIIIRKLGGIATTEEYISSVEDKHAVLTEAVLHLFNTIGKDDILRQIEGIWHFEGKPLTKEQVNILKNQAETHEGSMLHKVLIAEQQYQANRRMFIDSKTQDDMIAGKLILFHTDIVKTTLKRIAQ